MTIIPFLGSVPATGDGLFGNAPKPAESTPAPALFGGGNLFGKKPEEQSSTTGTSSAPKPFFNLGPNDSGAAKDSAPAGEQSFMHSSYRMSTLIAFDMVH